MRSLRRLHDQYKKTFSMEFEEIEKEENQIAFRRTRGGVNGAGDIEAQLDSIYKFFTECVKVLFALVFLLILIVFWSHRGLGLRIVQISDCTLCKPAVRQELLIS